MTWNGLWALHTWALTDQPCTGVGTVRTTPTLAPAQLACVLDAYASDPIWNDLIDNLRATYPQHLMSRVATADCLVLDMGPSSRSDGVSVLDPSPDAHQHFVTGICVHPRAQGAGLGRQLLDASLQRLRQQGCAEARAFTRSGSRADHLYTRAGSTRECPATYQPVTPASVTS